MANGITYSSREHFFKILDCDKLYILVFLWQKSRQNKHTVLTNSGTNSENLESCR